MKGEIFKQKIKRMKGPHSVFHHQKLNDPDNTIMWKVVYPQMS